MLSAAKTPKESPKDAAGLRPVRAVAEFLAISRSKVYQLMETGDLPYVKLGKSRRVRWADVLALVERNTIGTA
jgi:excisionase family DNA binding protein